MKISFAYIEVFSGALSKYGGHSQWLSSVTGLDYLMFCWWHPFREWRLEARSNFYDTYHSHIWFGPFTICWGGPHSFKESDL